MTLYFVLCTFWRPALCGCVAPLSAQCVHHPADVNTSCLVIHLGEHAARARQGTLPPPRRLWLVWFCLRCCSVHACCARRPWLVWFRLWCGSIQAYCARSVIRLCRSLLLRTVGFFACRVPLRSPPLSLKLLLVCWCAGAVVLWWWWCPEPQNRDRLSGQVNLADALCHQGEYNEAEQMYRAALAAQQFAFGHDSPDVLTTSCNLVSPGARCSLALPPPSSMAATTSYSSAPLPTLPTLLCRASCASFDPDLCCA